MSTALDHVEGVVSKLAEQSDVDLELLGVYDALETEDGIRTTYPQIARRQNAVTSDSSFLKYRDKETGITVTIPIDE